MRQLLSVSFIVIFIVFIIHISEPFLLENFGIHLEKYITTTLLAVDIFVIFFVLKEIRGLEATSVLVKNTINLLDDNIKQLGNTNTIMTKSVQSIGQDVETIGISIRLLERDKIYFYLSETAQKAEKYVHHLSLAQSTLEINDEEEKKRVSEFLDALKEASKTRDVKILGPDLSSKIGGMWERKKSGCEVKVSPSVTTYDIRIQIVDDKKVVIGVGPPTKRSEHGFLIESYVLATLLDDNFMQLWGRSRSLDEHTIDVIMRHIDVALPIKTLEKMTQDLLFLSSEVTDEIIQMLVNQNLLIRDKDDMIYNYKLIHELESNHSSSDEELKAFLIDKGIHISDNIIEKSIRLMREKCKGDKSE